MEKFNPTTYKNKYMNENYDRLNIQVPKGRKEVIKAFSKTKGYDSLNSYVNALIDADMASNNQNGGGIGKV